jgi:hypothetical protein
MISRSERINQIMDARRQRLADANWEESKHPRGEGGKFGSGGGSTANREKTANSPAYRRGAEAAAEFEGPTKVTGKEPGTFTGHDL